MVFTAPQRCRAGAWERPWAAVSVANAQRPKCWSVSVERTPAFMGRVVRCLVSRVSPVSGPDTPEPGHLGSDAATPQVSSATPRPGWALTSSEPRGPAPVPGGSGRGSSETLMRGQQAGSGASLRDVGRAHRPGPRLTQRGPKGAP